ncbi:MAG TPA: hypothetical protein VNW90_05045, partial [Acetobacteraceae bacterium]|jgi:hypothetical protein|nr:hypothetical protein [Acetobacteraceae bacterium]
MKPHFQYHVHQATAENLNNGRYDKHPASATRLYASFAEATRELDGTASPRKGYGSRGVDS